VSEKEGVVMIPHMHDDKTQGEEQLPSPVENKQMAAPLEKRSKPTPASPKRWIGVLLSILGIVLALAGGFVIAWPWRYMGVSETNAFLISVLFGGGGFLIFVGAALFRSWWALLIVSVAWVVGWILAGGILSPLVYGWYCGNIADPCTYSHWYGPGWSAVQALFETGVIWRDMGTWLPIAFVPLLICTVLGAWVGVFLNNWWKKRRQQR
jgi:hypothetical protein